MRRIVYKGLVSLPTKIISAITSAIGVAGTFWPDWVKKLIDTGISPDTVRYIGMALVAWGFIHLLLLWLLKPSALDRPSGEGVNQTTNGPNSPNFNLSISDNDITGCGIGINIDGGRKFQEKDTSAIDSAEKKSD